VQIGQAVRDYQDFLSLPAYRRQEENSSRRWLLDRGKGPTDDPIRRLVKFLLPTKWTLSAEEWARTQTISVPLRATQLGLFIRWYKLRPAEEEDPSQPEMKGTSPAIEHLARFILALVSGATVIVPMIIIVYDSSKLKSVITTSVAVLLFALFISLSTRSSDQETLAATATYAAVLIVFVGTSGTVSG
jgi:hypothetical protein